MTATLPLREKREGKSFNSAITVVVCRSNKVLSDSAEVAFSSH